MLYSVKDVLGKSQMLDEPLSGRALGSLKDRDTFRGDIPSH